MCFRCHFLGFFVQIYVCCWILHTGTHTGRFPPSFLLPALQRHLLPLPLSPFSIYLSVCPSLEDEGGKGKGGGRFGIGVTERERKGKGGFGIRDFTRLVVLFSSPFSPSRKRRKRDIWAETVLRHVRKRKKKRIRISVLASLSLTRGEKDI